jgi:hypothetical protein
MNAETWSDGGMEWWNGCLMFWGLKFDWDLELGIWDFGMPSVEVGSELWSSKNLSDALSEPLY